MNESASIGDFRPLDSVKRPVLTGVIPFALAIFLSAALLFQVELILGKYILPWWGGTPSVWTTSLVFFQALLLAGYAYAHAICRRLSVGAQLKLHWSLLGACLLLMAALSWRWGSPILPGVGWKPVGSTFHGHPAAEVLVVLTISIGMPFFLLAATGPLLQAWFHRARADDSPYWLYALSNLGSLLALLSYPLVVEPYLRLRLQAWLWFAGFVIFAAVCCYCAVLMNSGIRHIARNAANHDSANHDSMQVPLPAPLGSQQVASGGATSNNPATDVSVVSEGFTPIADVSRTGAHDKTSPGIWLKLLWLALAACASVTLLASTNLLCQEVASVPLLWVIPLALYLLSFILCFQNDSWYWRGFFQICYAASAAMACVPLYYSPRYGAAQRIGLVLFLLFSCCMVCHGELSRLRPAPRYLTSFYLMVAAGGALGGVFVALLAPQLFPSFWEFQIGVWMSGALVFMVLVHDKTSWLYRKPWIITALVVVAALLPRLQVATSMPEMAERLSRWHYYAALLLLALCMIGLAVYLGGAARGRQLSRRRVLWLYGCVALILISLATALGTVAGRADRGAFFRARNFYGTVSVLDFLPNDPKFSMLMLMHGRTTHGVQFRNPDFQMLATGYYGVESGIGRALLFSPRALSPQPRGMNVGVIGLGVGTLTHYARAGDRYRFYEINPTVIELSTANNAIFRYLMDAKSEIEIVPGDARTALERELNHGETQKFDVLAIDAFNSDSIPVHLLTAEAMALYLKHMRDSDGILAFHVSNTSLDFRPVVLGLAEHFHLASAIIYSKRKALGTLDSEWILLSPNPSVLAVAEISQAAAKESNFKAVPLWTDDYSSLIPLLKP